MDSPFELVEVHPEMVILKVTPLTNLGIARFPWVNATYDYITVTRGKDHILTIVYKDGHTWNFSWGYSGYTLVSDSVNRLKSQVIHFIERDCHIILDFCGEYIEHASIYYNSNYEKWQLTVEGDGHSGIIWSGTASCLEDMIEESKAYLGKELDWHHEIAVTGIDTWEADL